MNLKQKRAAALKSAWVIADAAKAAKRELTTGETDSIQGHIDEIKTLDVAIADAQASSASIDALAAMGPGEVRPLHGAPTGQAKRLAWGGLTSGIVSGMQRFGAQASPTSKGLVPAGETVVDVPLVNPGQPIAATTGQEHPPRLVDVLPAVARTAPVYSVLKQRVISTPGAAGVVAPGDLKPTKKLGVKREDARLRVVAVVSEPIDKYDLEDASNLRTWVGTELSDAIQQALETEVLTGDGTGEHFTGLASTSGVQTQSYETDALITVQYGLSKLEALGIAPAWVALPASAWLAMQTTRNSGGSFDLGGPIDATKRTAWGTPVVVVPGLADGEGYVVGQETLSVSYGPGGVRVEWGTPGDAFNRNEVVARVEGRFNLDVLRPHGVVQLAMASS